MSGLRSNDHILNSARGEQSGLQSWECNRACEGKLFQDYSLGKEQCLSRIISGFIIEGSYF
jgi:hypothetical protein